MSRIDPPATTRVTDKGQTTIPKTLREKYGIEPGDEVIWIEGDEGITVRKKGDLPNYGFLAENMSDEEAETVAEALVEDTGDAQVPEFDG